MSNPAPPVGQRCPRCGGSGNDPWAGDEDGPFACRACRGSGRAVPDAQPIESARPADDPLAQASAVRERLDADLSRTSKEA